MELEGDIGGQQTAIIDLYVLWHIWHKIACQLFDILNDQWKNIQLQGLKKVHYVCARNLCIFPLHDFNCFMVRFYPILTLQTLF